MFLPGFHIQPSGWCVSAWKIECSSLSWAVTKCMENCPQIRAVFHLLETLLLGRTCWNELFKNPPFEGCSSLSFLILTFSSDIDIFRVHITLLQSQLSDINIGNRDSFTCSSSHHKFVVYAQFSMFFLFFTPGVQFLCPQQWCRSFSKCSSAICIKYEKRKSPSKFETRARETHKSQTFTNLHEKSRIQWKIFNKSFLRRLGEEANPSNFRGFSGVASWQIARHPV